MCEVCGEEMPTAHLCQVCECCSDCCECAGMAEDDPEWDEDFGGYPDEEPVRYARYCRAMRRAMDEGVD